MLSVTRDKVTQDDPTSRPRPSDRGDARFGRGDVSVETVTSCQDGPKVSRLRTMRGFLHEAAADSAEALQKVSRQWITPHAIRSSGLG